MALLHVEHLTKKFGGLTAVNDVTLKVEEGSITGLIGPNGAGKTTCFNLITGFLKPTAGKIVFNDNDITNKQPTELVTLGMTRTFQIAHCFQNMTVLENVMAGYYTKTSSGIWKTIIRSPKVRKENREVRGKALQLVNELGMGDIADTYASKLSTGQQKLLDIIRAVATDPKLLFLDEPAAGLNTGETETLSKMIRLLNDRGITILVIDHSMRFMMSIAEYIYVMNFGSLMAEGTPTEVSHNPAVAEAYLGKEVVYA